MRERASVMATAVGINLFTSPAFVGGPYLAASHARPLCSKTAGLVQPIKINNDETVDEDNVVEDNDVADKTRDFDVGGCAVSTSKIA